MEFRNSIQLIQQSQILSRDGLDAVRWLLETGKFCLEIYRGLDLAYHSIKLQQHDGGQHKGHMPLAGLVEDLLCK